MANKVFTAANNIVTITVDGDQTVATISAMADEAFDLCQKQKQAGRAAIILDDIRSIGKVLPEGRKAVVDILKSGEYDRLAMVGHGGALKLGSNLLLHATGKGARVRYFDDYDKAVLWLLAA